MISGRTRLIAHIGVPTYAFKASLIYNPWFDANGIDAAVVPLGIGPEDFATGLPLVFRMSNVDGALITMPHKVAVLDLVDEVRPAAAIAGSANAVRLIDGRLVADMFDGQGFVRGMQRRGRSAAGASALVVGNGGVGCAIAASLAAAGASSLTVVDPRQEAQNGLAARLRAHYPDLHVATGSNDPAGHDIVVNATPLGMKEGDPMPLDVDRLQPGQFVGEVVMAQQITPFLAAAQAAGCATQVGTDMLFEQIPAYLEFFDLGTPTADELRRHAVLPTD